MANRIGFTDTLTGKETVCRSWAKMALTVIQLSDSHNDWTRFLPFTLTIRRKMNSRLIIGRE